MWYIQKYPGTDSLLQELQQEQPAAEHQQFLQLQAASSGCSATTSVPEPQQQQQQQQQFQALSSGSTAEKDVKAPQLAKYRQAEEARAGAKLRDMHCWQHSR
jgi:hypothetical protein